MSYKVKIMPQARRELFEAAEFIALDNPQKADEFFEKIITYVSETLSLFPESGVIYKNLIRKLTYKKHSAFYLINETNNVIEVLHIVDLSKPLQARNINLDD